MSLVLTTPHGAPKVSDPCAHERLEARSHRILSQTGSAASRTALLEVHLSAARCRRFRLVNRLLGILHGCLRHGTLYDEHTAWAHGIDQATAA